MAHNLNTRNGEVSFFTVKEKAWHGLGKVLQNNPNSEEAIKLANLDFEVEKIQNHIQLPDGSFKPAGDSFSTVRKDTYDVLGNKLGNKYTVIQNTRAFDFFDNIVSKGEAIYETAGALGKGERIFITAKLPDYIHVKGNDIIEKYLLLTNSHDGTSGITAMFTPIRVVCNNTLQAALGGKNSKNSISIAHTSKAEDKLAQAAKVMGISNQLATELETVFNRMVDVRMTDLQVKQFVTSVMMPENVVAAIQKAEKEGNMELAAELAEMSTRTINKIDKVMDYYGKGVGQMINTTKGTVFGAYNAITGYFNNVKDFKTAEAKMESNIFGNGAKTSQKALDLALTLI